VKLLISILLIWNLVTFLLMGIDKKKAVADKRRISEKTLLTCSFAMGGLGIGMGGLYFHHKTRKRRFIILVPISIIFNLSIIYVLFYIGII